MNHLPQAPENKIKGISVFFKICGEIRASQGAPTVSTTPVANLKFFSDINNTVGKFSHLPLASTTPAINLQPVTKNGTISNYSHLEVNLKETFYPYVNSKSQRCPD
jgi:hypothetical protein